MKKKKPVIPEQPYSRATEAVNKELEKVEIRAILERMLENKHSLRDAIFLGEIMKVFKESKEFLILKTMNEATLKNMLTTGKPDTEAAERFVGKMEGIQSAFEDKVLALIVQGDAAQNQMAQDNEDAEEAADDKNIGTDDDEQVAEIPKEKKRRKNA